MIPPSGREMSELPLADGARLGAAGAAVLQHARI